MNVIVVTSQSDFDSLDASYSAPVCIEIRATERIVVNRNPGNAYIEVRDKSYVEVRDDIPIFLEVTDNASIKARYHTHVVALDNSSVEAYDNSSIVAWNNANVKAHNNSYVKALDNASIEMWDNVSVTAKDDSFVVAHGDTSVTAYNTASVEAWDNCCLRVMSPRVRASLYNCSVCFPMAGGRVGKKSDTCTVINPPSSSRMTTDRWIEEEGVRRIRNNVILYKRVSSKFKTQEGAPYETTWKIGAKLTHPAWNPTREECGGGKFHAYSRAYFCDDFREKTGDRYVAVRVPIADLYAWPYPEYPHKISFRSGTVLYECNRFGKQLKKEVNE